MAIFWQVFFALTRMSWSAPVGTVLRGEREGELERVTDEGLSFLRAEVFQRIFVSIYLSLSPARVRCVAFTRRSCGCELA